MTTGALEESEITALRQLLDRQAITDCIHRYARGLDRRDAELIRSAYHPDAIEDHGAYIGEVDGLVDYLFGAHARFSGDQRHVTTSNVEIDGDTAHAESYFLSAIPIDAAEKLMLTAGRYIDRLERRDGAWRILRRVVVLEWHASPKGGTVEPKVHVAPRLDRDDISYARPLDVTREHH